MYRAASVARLGNLHIAVWATFDCKRWELICKNLPTLFLYRKFSKNVKTVQKSCSKRNGLKRLFFAILT